MSHDTLVVRWSHHDYAQPVPLVCRYEVEVGDVIDSSHYGKVKVIDIQRTQENRAYHQVGFVFEPVGRNGEFPRSERYSGLSMVPRFEKAGA